MPARDRGIDQNYIAIAPAETDSFGTDRKNSAHLFSIDRAENPNLGRPRRDAAGPGTLTHKDLQQLGTEG